MAFVSKYSFRNPVKRFLAALFDAAGGVLFFPLKFLAPPLKSQDIKKILVIRLDHIGDVLMTRPALESLAAKFPAAQIHFLLSEELILLLKGDAGITEFIGFKNHWFQKKKASALRPEFFAIVKRLQKQKYDLAIDFRGDLRNILLLFLAGIPHRWGYGITAGGFLLTHEEKYDRKKHQVLSNLKLLSGLGIQEAVIQTPLIYKEKRRKEFLDACGTFFQKKMRIVLQAGAGYMSKRWPASRFEELIARVLDQNLAQIFLIGTETEKQEMPFAPRPGLMDMRGKTALEELPILFDLCDLFVGNDSGPAHIAAAQGIETVVLFSGTNEAAVWKPWTSRLHLLQHAVPCSPCEAKICPLGHHDCMKKINVDEVFEKIKMLLSSQQATFGKSGA